MPGELGLILPCPSTPFLLPYLFSPILAPLPFFPLLAATPPLELTFELQNPHRPPNQSATAEPGEPQRSFPTVFSNELELNHIVSRDQTELLRVSPTPAAPLPLSVELLLWSSPGPARTTAAPSAAAVAPFLCRKPSSGDGRGQDAPRQGLRAVLVPVLRFAGQGVSQLPRLLSWCTK